MRFHRFLPVVLILILSVLNGCQKTESTKEKKETPDHPIISAVTSGFISRESVIRVQFTEPVYFDSAQLNTPVEKSPVSFKPKIDGNAVWTGSTTLEFRPSERLKDGQEYTATLNLSSLLAEKTGSVKYEFTFSALRQAFQIEREGLQSADSKNLTLQQFTGTIVTVDVDDNSEIEKIVTARQKKRTLPIRWVHNSDRLNHGFTIDSIARGEDSSHIVLEWNGAPIGVDSKGSETITIPSLNNFTVTSARAVQETETYLEIRFSDPLDRRQNLKGLIRADKKDLRFTIDNNTVRVYSSSGWAGDYRVSVARGVRNSMKQRLKNTWKSTITFSTVKPEVRFVGKGVIIPTTKGQTVPIEAVNLRAIIVEATRIFETNIPQFLQVNDLEGKEEVKRVGRILWKKVVPIDPNAKKPNQWVKYGLDVSELIADHPGGLYSLKLSFRRHHIIYRCSDSVPIPDEEVYEINNDIEGNEESEESFWDYYEGDGSGSDWSQRENPCHRAYYKNLGGHDIRVTRNVLISDIGMIVKKGRDNSIRITTTNIRSAAPLGGVQVKILNYQQQVTCSGITDDRGMLTLQTSQTPFVAVASANGQRGYCKLDNGSARSISHFDVGGASIQKGIKGYLYGERGVWRPGDTLFLTFILHDPDKKLPADHPVKFELYDAQYKPVTSMKKTKSLNGFYTFIVPTRHSAPTGDWLAKVKVGGATFEKVLKVETVMPNRLKIEFDFGKEMLAGNETVTAKLHSKWLHGATAGNLKADITCKLFPARTAFPRYSDYIFDDPVRRYAPEEFSAFDGSLDGEGNADVSISVNAENLSPGMLSAQFTTRVFEPGGAFSIDRFAIPYHPYSTYIGMKTPKGDKARGMLLTDTTHIVHLAGLNYDGTPAKSTRVAITLRKIKWRWWWEKGTESLADYAESRSYTPVLSDTVTITNGKGTWKFKIKYPSWGRYLLRAVDLNGNHATGKIVYIDWPGWAGRAQKDAKGGASILTFSADKNEYKVGETVSVVIPSSPGGRGLVSIENGSKVITQDWIDGAENSVRYQFEATPAMAPNIYISVTYLQPHLTAGNDVPIRTYGVIPVKVIDPATKIAPKLAMPDVLVPEEKAKITVSETSGKPMTYTLALVDEGLLDLTRFGTPDPWNHFFSREALGVTTWDIFDQVAGAYGATLEQLLTIGGDDEGDKGNKRANRFPPMVRFYGPFELKGGKTNTHTIDIPQYIGSVRTMVVAGQNGAFGNTDKATPVRKPLMLLGTLPRVLSIQETCDLPVSVFALDPKVKNVSVSITSDGPLTIIGKKTIQLIFSSPGDKIAGFTAQAGTSTGVATVTIKAVGGGEKITQKIELDVRNPVNPVTEVVETTLEKSKSWKSDIHLPGVSGTNSATLEVSSVPPLNLGQRLDYLIRYPHGCVEQTTSSVFPQVYLDKLLDLSPDYRNKIEHNIKAGIDRIRMFQTSDGGFGYWPGAPHSQEWASNYAGHFLLEARQAGYNVPAGVIQQWTTYQTKKARSWVTHSCNGDLNQSYRLYTLALAGSPDIGSMNRLRERKNISNTTKWRLAAAYQLMGQEDVAQQIVNGLKTTVKKYRELSGTFGSDLRDQAMILETLSLLKDSRKAGALAKEISKRLSDAKGWLSTQTTAYALIAMAKYSGFSGNAKTMKFTIAWNDGKTEKHSSGKPVFQVPLELSDDTTAMIEVSNKSDGTIYPRLILNGIPKIGTEKAAENGLSIRVLYESVDSNESVSNVDNMAQGDDIVAIISVKNTGNQGTYNEVALTHLVPSGYEIHNERLSLNRNRSTIWNYQDIRDDRIYTYFDIAQDETKKFRVHLNASYCGKFYMPMISAEAMYDATINGRTAGKWIAISKPGN